MKLMEVYKLMEIGDRIITPSGATYKTGWNTGVIKFSNKGVEYKIIVNIIDPQYTEDNPELEGTHFDMGIVFAANDDYDYNLTNSHQVIEVMGNLVGSIEEWINQYKKMSNEEFVFLTGIQFEPKDENGEPKTENRRDKLYRHYLIKFAKKYNSSCSFTTTKGTVKTSFNPPLKI